MTVSERLCHTGNVSDSSITSAAVDKLRYAIALSEIVESFSDLGFTLEDIATATGVEVDHVDKWRLHNAFPLPGSAPAKALGELRALSLWALEDGQLHVSDFVEFCRDTSVGLWRDEKGNLGGYASPLQALSLGNPHNVENIANGMRCHFPVPPKPFSLAQI